MALFKRILPVALTIGIGWLVLLSFLFPNLPLFGVPFAQVRSLLLEWAVILAAGALVLGFANLIAVHARRIRQGQGVGYSLVLIASALIMLGLWIGSLLRGEPPTQLLDGAFDLIVAPMQSALGALLAVVLAIAGFRALHVRRSAGMVFFVLTAVVVVLTQPITPSGGLLGAFRVLIIDPITTGSLRGLLLGATLGGVAVGLRLLVGADKPQGD
jgi:hypothetical protein